MVKSLPAMHETQVPSLGQGDPLEKGMATHSSILNPVFHGQRSLAGFTPWVCKQLDMTEQLTHKKHQVPFLYLLLLHKFTVLLLRFYYGPKL